jgi:anhydro-N-acetylmuramic acid kinase
MTEKQPRLLVGLMCGTSGDGIAGALISTTGYGRARRLEVLSHAVIAYPAELRRRLFALFPPQRFSARELGAVHRDLGPILADAAMGLVASAGVTAADLSAVGVQAPTLLHEPPAKGRLGVHIEVARLGTTVVCDLRPSDIAVGGHGAPLSAFVDYALFGDAHNNRAVQNIGGIANVTYLPRGGELDQVLAFDTGPGNMIIDEVVRRLSSGRLEFDRDGMWAANGSIDKSLLDWLLGHPYLELPVPKTSGREDFGAPYVDEILARAQRAAVRQEDIVATVTAFTAASIARHYVRDLSPLGGVDEMILYGGGAHNGTLVRLIAEQLPDVAIRRQEEFGIPGDARESVTWAILADETLAGNVANVPSASGATKRVLLGRILRLDPLDTR